MPNLDRVGAAGRRAAKTWLATLCGLVLTGPALAEDWGQARWTRRWSFEHDAAGWRLQPAGAGPARAAWAAGALTLQARLVGEAGAAPSCPVASAEQVFGDVRSQEGGDAALRILLTVRQWDLGLGHLDDHVPLLEVVHHGQRTAVPVRGFTRMPGEVELRWTQAQGWTAAYDRQAARSLTLRSSPASGTPSLRLWIDGCSQGMRQALALTEVSVSVR